MFLGAFPYTNKWEANVYPKVWSNGQSPLDGRGGYGLIQGSSRVVLKTLNIVPHENIRVIGCLEVISSFHVRIMDREVNWIGCYWV